MPTNDTNRITIRLTRNYVDYIAYTAAPLWPDGSLDITDLGIGKPGDKFCVVVRIGAPIV